LTTLEQDMAATLNARLAGWKDSTGATRKPKIVVLDFCTWERQWIQFGAWLADQLSAGLSSASGQFEVIDRAQLAALLEARRLANKDEVCLNKSLDAAQVVGADFYATATFVALDKDLGVTLNVVRAMAAGL
jgi:curli biogenesis system outer membrane secretion channel CsgG